MIITFLIGNGFDLSNGLKTRYSDFYDYMLSNNMVHNSQILKDALNNPSLWSDFEMGLCKDFTLKITEKYEDLILFEDDVNYVRKNLANYLASVEEEFHSYDYGNSKYDIFNEDIKNIERKIQGQNYEFLSSKIRYGSLKEKDYYFINFNYTDILDYYINGVSKHHWGYDSFPGNIDVVSIHGTINDNLVLGYGDEEKIQINEQIRDYLPLDLICKTRYNKVINNRRHFRALEMLKEADIIMIYGMSLGESDSNWWEEIGRIISKNNIPLIYFKHVNQFDGFYDYKQNKENEKIIQLFMSYMNNLDLYTVDKERIKDNIVIDYSNNIFNFTDLKRI